MQINEQQILAALDEEQKEVTNNLLEPVCVLAGAGTGKTRAITHRIAYGVLNGTYKPSQILAVTFTSRAAGEMRSRLGALGIKGVQTRTFHAAALRQLQYFWGQTIGGASPKIVPHKAGLVAEAAGRLKIVVDRPAIRDLASEIEWAKVSLLTSQGYMSHNYSRGRPGGFDKQTVGNIFQVYEDLKGERNIIDFEDVLLIMAGMIQENPQIAQTIREQYCHFIVDEYQDVSPLQQRLLDLWLGHRNSICVVGDANQTIYSFSGATPKYLTNFSQKYPTATTVKLVKNYRSTPQIVTLANQLILDKNSQNKAQEIKLQPQQESGQQVDSREYENDDAEGYGVAKQIKKFIQEGISPQDIAILYRTNGQSEVFEQALSKENIGYVLKGGERFFQREEIRKALVALKIANKVESNISTQELVIDVLSGQGYTIVPPNNSGALRERWESQHALVVLAKEMAEQAAILEQKFTLTDFIADLDSRAAMQHAPVISGVTLASLHSAKGLEWKVVFLVGLSEGLLPITFAESAEDFEEEKRIFYVGITRAKEYLSLSWAATRHPGSKSMRKPSRFLESIFPNSISGKKNIFLGFRKNKEKDNSFVIEVSKTCRSCGKVLFSGAQRKVGRCDYCPVKYDENILDELKEWRAKTAQSNKVPAYVIFTDATLMAISEKCPKDKLGLATIPGVGAIKLEKYGEDVINIVSRRIS